MEQIASPCIVKHVGNVVTNNLVWTKAGLLYTLKRDGSLVVPRAIYLFMSSLTHYINDKLIGIAYKQDLISGKNQ